MRARSELLARWVPRAVVVFAVGTIVAMPRTSRGSIAEQRSRLPPPAKCEDKVEGEWRAHQFNDVWQQWVIFRLVIRRKPGSATDLLGNIYNETWHGTKKDQEPGLCSGTVPYRVRVSMPAIGTFTDGSVSFQGTSWKFDEIVCGRLPAGFGYRLDHFTGKVDETRQEFQSVNNDGGRAVNEPTLFRRVKCFDSAAQKPPVKIDPPPFVPPDRSSGC
jgi:hypothetical protein